MSISASDIWQRGQMDPLSIPDVILFARLAETIAWCNQILERTDVTPSIRSPELMPRILHQGRDDAVCEVGRSRSWRIRAPVSIEHASCHNLSGGRLLVYFPDADLSDGAAEAVSGMFFDVCNTPPWDTWIGYFDEEPNDLDCYRTYLLAFVPDTLISYADAGIVVNPEECIRWLSDVDVKLRQRFYPGLNG